MGVVKPAPVRSSTPRAIPIGPTYSPPRGPWSVAVAAVAVLSVSVSVPAGAQSASKPPTILDVLIDAAPDEDAEQLRQLSGLVIGKPYRALDVRKGVRRLYQLGRFENVYVHRADVPGGVKVRLTMPPVRRLQVLRIESTDVLGETDVLEALDVTIGSRFDARDLPSWEVALTKLLVRQGFRDPAVGLAYRRLDDVGGVELIVRIDEGPLTRLRKVVLRGRTRQPLWRLAEVITIKAGDVLEVDDVDKSVRALQTFYRNEGYLDANVELVEVRPIAKGAEPVADVVLRIEAGPEVTIRFDGNVAVGTRALEEDGELLTELGTGPSALAEVRERIISRYERKGYWRARVATASRATPDGRKKEVLFSIREGEPAFVRNLVFPGNVLFDQDRLEDTVVQLVVDALGDADGRPGANPAVLDTLLGRAPGPGASRQPDTSAPDPRRVYIPRAYRAARDELADLYRAEGYQTVEVGDPLVERVRGQDMVDVVIPVRPGVRWRIDVVSFSGNEQITSLELIDIVDLDFEQEGGQPLTFDDVEKARRTILKHYQDLGHLYVRLTEELRQMPVRGDLRRQSLETTTSTAPQSDLRRVCRAAEAAGRATCEVELMFRISEGPRVTTRDVIIKGVETTWDSIIENEIVVKPDTVLKAKDIEQTRDNLLRLGLFDLVEVRPLDENEVSDRKDVLVEVKERDHYWLELGIGASTEDGLRGSAAFGDGNLFGSALRLQLRAGLNVWLPFLLVLYNDAIRDQIEPFYDSFGVLGRLEYEFAAGFSYPRIPGLPRGFSAGLNMIVLRDFDPAFLENTQTLTLTLNYKSGVPKIGQPRPPSFQLRGSLERADLECNRTFRQVAPGVTPNTPIILVDPCSANRADPENPSLNFRATNFYLSAGPRVIWDLRDDSLDPKSGAFFEVEAAYEYGLDADSPDYVEVSGRADFYARLLPRLVLAISAQAAQLLQVGDDDREIPLNRRLFAGGRTTIRGYAEKTLLPQDAELDPVTGRPLSTISNGGSVRAALKSELRVLLFPSLALSVFYDVGDLWREGGIRLRTDIRLADDTVVSRTLAQGAGVGLRVATPIGPLAIDLAVPVNRRDPGPASPQFHFAVGSF